MNKPQDEGKGKMSKPEFVVMYPFGDTSKEGIFLCSRCHKDDYDCKCQHTEPANPTTKDGQTIEEIIEKIIFRVREDDGEALKSGEMTAEEEATQAIEKLIEERCTESRIDEWDFISEIQQASNQVAFDYMVEQRKERIAQLQAQQSGSQEASND